ncbi:hypothetical protein SAMN05660284_02819 [Formivibrio citricus]|uniref:Uncharacterized protein n=1 Tax=Formivibrio citricus TaxID=83765 RepID=A0A1I5E381_9NEIS|nr:hypothetical protein [Formivibrio citricus]SFO05740.1 hypothetical protein SAMN05660284_02819 [Formivibrio citricus]
MKTRSLYSLPIAVLLAASQLHAAGVKVGWIDSLQPANTGMDTVRIERDGKNLPYTPANRMLYDGDRIVLTRDNLTLKLVIGEKNVQVTSSQARPDAPYQIKQAGEIPTVQKNLLDWMGDKLKGKSAQRNPVKTISASARNQSSGAHALSIPALAVGNPLIAGGTRDLKLSWQGGTAPYRITIKQKTGQTAADNLGAPAHTFSGIVLQEGTLQLTLEDSQGKRYIETIRVVPAAQRPAMPLPLKEARLDETTRNRLYGEWLQEQGNNWGLEAMQWMGQ